MNKNMRFVAAMLLACMAVSASAKTKVKINDCEFIGFNALDHVLQKPQGNPSFPEDDRGFGNHIFLGVSGGGSLLGSELSGRMKNGLQLGGQLGGWITPVHGIRLSGEIGKHSVHANVERPWFAAARAEYLINFTSLLRGYAPSRRFELIGSVGVEGQRIHHAKEWGYALGYTAALQTRFNVAPSLFLFMEPRLSVMTGRRYDDGHDWRRMKAEVQFNVGLGYRVLRGYMRTLGSTEFSQKKDDNLFFGVEGGLWDFTRHDFPARMLREHNNPFGSAFVGKMFSSTSGIQAVMDFGRYSVSGSKSQVVGLGMIDYVLNLGNACGGYRPRQVFQVLLNAGVGGAYVNKTNIGIVPGVEAGIMGLFRLSPNWGLFVHPQVHVFPTKFATSLGRIGSPFASVGVGLRYSVGDFSRLFPESYADYNADRRHWFLNFAGGAGIRLRGDYGPGMMLNVGFGKRFTPVSSWRVSAEGSIFTKSPYYISTSLPADYLASITTSMYGYNPDRVFDLQLV
ncbi:MAG: hypothetical protein K2M97_03440, partial [Muribaculaceae bacterium]|nr:hypothetical protein [Muribaculaceae bacterium]